MLDLHSHIAWNIDDGIPCKEDALQALVQAKEDGITAICSTPHFVPGQLDQQMFDRIRDRQRELASISDIPIYFGAEIMINSAFIENLDKHLYQTINDTKYMLVEYDVCRDIHHIPNIMDPLYEMDVRGYTPVIAHIERYFHQGIDWGIVNEWKNDGYVLQINRTSIMGMNGKQVERNAKELLEHGIGHIVATDAHRADGHRVERLSDAYQRVSEWIDPENAKLMFVKNPQSILDGKNLADIYVKPKKKKRFCLFRK